MKPTEPQSDPSKQPPSREATPRPPPVQPPHGLPGSIQGLPGSIRGLPGSIQGLPGSCWGLPGSCRGLPGSIQGLPGSIRGLPGSFRPGAASRLPPLLGVLSRRPEDDVRLRLLRTLVVETPEEPPQEPPGATTGVQVQLLWSPEVVMEDGVKLEMRGAVRSAAVMEMLGVRRPLHGDAETQALCIDTKTQPLHGDTMGTNTVTQPLHTQTETQPLYNETETQPLHIDTETQPLCTDTKTQPLHTKTETQPLHGDIKGTNIETQPLHTETETQPLHTKMETQPLHTETETQSSSIPPCSVEALIDLYDQLGPTLPSQRLLFHEDPRDYQQFLISTSSDFLHSIFNLPHSEEEEPDEEPWEPIEPPPSPPAAPTPQPEELQRRLSRLWAALQVPVGQQLAMAVKYGPASNQRQLVAALELWDEAADLIEQREQLLALLEGMELHNSDPNRFFRSQGQRGSPNSNPIGFQGRYGLPSWVGEIRRQLHAELRRYEGKLMAVMKKLKEEYGDEVTLKGRSYEEKMRRDRGEMLYRLQQGRRAAAMGGIMQTKGGGL
uniref:Coiled-coil domain containing 87 n=1 Tax=Coturnix japonica TaxID=93934 RepID=A0A8C2SNV0_COTJA